MTRSRLPEFIIIGAQRCGTTSLYEYLTSHPRVVAASEKELHFFNLNFERGVDWYEGQFPERAEGVISGEASPYYLFHPLVAQRIARILSNVRLIALLRNPVDRAYSHYQHEVRIHAEHLAFEQAIRAERERLAGETERLISNPGYDSFAHRHFSYLARGVYIDQLDQYNSFLTDGRLKIVRSEDIYQRERHAIEELCDYLELDRLSTGHLAHRNEGDYQPIGREVREELAEYFKPHNERLYTRLGRDMGWE